MISDLQNILSTNVKGMKKSAIRELLKLTGDPEIISFAGGLPSPLTFPKNELKTICCDILDEDGDLALQYGATEGDKVLRQLLVDHYRKEGLDIGFENIMITTASQQGLDLTGKIFCDRGDKVVVGLPSYLGGLGAFNAYGAEFVGVLHDEHGMRSDLLEEKLAEMKANGEKPKFIYIIPDFQNPAGVTMPEFRRIEIIEIAKKYDVLILEDSPYRELRFEGEHQKMMYSLDNTGQVITLGTFSKIFVPGFRIGWVIADAAVLDKYVVAKQSTDLCTSPFVQKIAAKYLASPDYEINLQKTIDMYKSKKEVMMKAFDDYMPEGVTWTKPEGGLFLFVNLPDYMDSEELFMEALKEKVAFVIGHVFHCDNSGKNTLRINFSYATKEDIDEGIKRLANSIKKLMK